VRKPEGKRSLGRPRRRWVDNVRMDLGEVGWGDVDWIRLVQETVPCTHRIGCWMDPRTCLDDIEN
jgi:hypothetical protein